MNKLTVNLNGIEFNVVVETEGDYPNITILEKDNPVCFVEVDTFERNIATIAYNEKEEDYENKTIFRKI